MWQRTKNIFGLLADLIGVLGALYFAYKTWGSFLAQHWLQTILSALMVVAFIYLSWSEYKNKKLVKKYERDILLRLLNPYVLVKRKEIKCYVQQDHGCRIEESFVIVCLIDDVVDTFRFILDNKAREVDIIENKTECKKIAGSITPCQLSLEDKTEYTVSFNHLSTKDAANLSSLNRGEHIVDIGWNVAAADATSGLPPISRSFDQCRGCEELVFRIIFQENDSPKKVLYRRSKLDGHDVGNDILIANPRTNADKTQEYKYTLKKDQLDTWHKYTVRWEW